MAEARGPVLIADDDESLVEYLQALLEGAGYRTLSAKTGQAALRAARDHRPLVVLLDIQLPDVNGYEVCRALRDEFGHALAIAFVSGIKTEQVDISSGLLVGADDYIVKPFDPSELLARVGALIRRVATMRRDAGACGANLTDREYEILRLLGDALDQKEIARQLSISPNTVARHIEHILDKLGVHSRAEAIATAYREQLIGPRG